MASIPFVAPSRQSNSGAWYALYTRHQHERSVANLLAGKGFQTFLPLYSTVHRWKDRRKHLLLPLYPGYVFLRDRLDRKLTIMMTPGVHSMVGTTDGPEPIPDFEIDVVKRIIESSLTVEPHPFLRDGDRVRVMYGPLEGIEGILLRKKNSLRLVMSVEMLMKSVAVEIDAFMVERISRPHWIQIDSRVERPLTTAC